MSIRTCFVVLSFLAATLGAGDARADCQTFLNEFFTWTQTPGTAVGFSYVSNQSNGVAGYSLASTLTGGLRYDSSTGHLRSYWYAPQLFSDRTNGSCGYQPFSWNNLDHIQLDLAPNGDIKLSLSTWGVDLYITNPTCENNVLYGFGPAAGTNNGGLPAMYVFRFFKTVVLN